MTLIRKLAVIIPIAALMLIVAACQDSSDNGDDAVDEVETPATETTDDEASGDDATETADDAEVTEEADAEESVTEEPETDETAVEGEETPVATDESDDAADETPAADEGTEGTAEDADADEILEQAAERAEELETAKFTLDGTGSLELQEIGEVNLSNAEGQVERPDRAQISVDVDAEIADVAIQILGVDGQVYFTDPLSGNWLEAPEEFDFYPAIMFDDENGLPALIRSVEDAELLGTEEIDGREAYQIFGIVPQDTINAGTGGVFQAESDVDFNVWVDTETHDVLQVLAEDPTDESESVWQMRIFEHDEPVEIDDPSGDES